MAMQRVPQVLHNATFSSRKPIETMTTMRSLIEKIEGTLGDRGRVLVRWSGTEPKLRVMVEGEDESAIDAYAQEIIAAATKDIEAAAAS